MVGLADRAHQVKKLLADLNRDITHLRQEFPLFIQREVELACVDAWTNRRMVSLETW
jgi:hypothetical protein